MSEQCPRRGGDDSSWEKCETSDFLIRVDQRHPRCEQREEADRDLNGAAFERSGKNHRMDLRDCRLTGKYLASDIDEVGAFSKGRGVGRTVIGVPCILLGAEQCFDSRLRVG